MAEHTGWFSSVDIVRTGDLPDGMEAPMQAPARPAMMTVYFMMKTR